MDTRLINTTALAYMGDAVYEIYIRKRVIEQGQAHVDRLHKAAITYVRASGQAKALRTMQSEGFLTESEEALVRRARNHKPASPPKNADIMDYKVATAFEALIGDLYLRGETERMEAIIYHGIEILERKDNEQSR